MDARAADGTQTAAVAVHPGRQLAFDTLRGYRAGRTALQQAQAGEPTADVLNGYTWEANVVVLPLTAFSVPGQYLAAVPVTRLGAARYAGSMARSHSRLAGCAGVQGPEARAVVWVKKCLHGWGCRGLYTRG
jgi:hypothetical protein